MPGKALGIAMGWLFRKWGKPVVIEILTGAAGNIGTDQAYRAEPDGYTLALGAAAPLVIGMLNRSFIREFFFNSNPLVRGKFRV